MPIMGGADNYGQRKAPFLRCFKTASADRIVRKGAMVLINIDKLREYMLDYVGAAAFGGFPAAIIDTMEIQDMAPRFSARKLKILG